MLSQNGIRCILNYVISALVKWSCHMFGNDCSTTPYKLPLVCSTSQASHLFIVTLLQETCLSQMIACARFVVGDTWCQSSYTSANVDFLNMSKILQSVLLSLKLTHSFSPWTCCVDIIEFFIDSLLLTLPPSFLSSYIIMKMSHDGV